jgi:predicted dienelactone hydrolase
MHRGLSVRLWSPGRSGHRGKARAVHAGGLAAPDVPGPAGLFEGSFTAVRNHALDGVPVAPGQFPIVVLEPGMGVAAPQYTVLAEDLASHGYLVAGVTPTFSANGTLLPGRLVRSTAVGNPAIVVISVLFLLNFV